ncbi:MAG: site-2 protease family protein [Pirellulaceae bacterium]
MSWSIRVGRFLGVDLYVHLTFLLLLAWVVIWQYLQTRNWVIALSELLFVSLVFGIIVLHEYGHAVAARQFGVATRDITLLPIGGVARLERIPENPYQEFVIAVAGPAVNVALGVLCLAWLLATGSLRAELTTLSENWLAGGLVAKLLAINILLVLFNMLPAFPMDGGRVLRAVLAMNMDYLLATQIAARVGQILALLLGFVGLFGAPMLLFIALFVWIGATQEASATAARASLAGVPVRSAMMSDFRVIRPDASLEVVAQHILAGFQQDFPVVEEDRVVGMITRDKLLRSLAERGPYGQVAEVMQRDFVTAHPDEPLGEAFQRLQTCDCHSIPVVQDGQLVGVISVENIGEFLMIQRAARQTPLVA